MTLMLFLLQVRMKTWSGLHIDTSSQMRLITTFLLFTGCDFFTPAPQPPKKYRITYRNCRKPPNQMTGETYGMEILLHRSAVKVCLRLPHANLRLLQRPSRYCITAFIGGGSTIQDLYFTSLAFPHSKPQQTTRKQIPSAEFSPPGSQSWYASHSKP